jgi:hypothetical protein
VVTDCTVCGKWEHKISHLWLDTFVQMNVCVVTAPAVSNLTLSMYIWSSAVRSSKLATRSEWRPRYIHWRASCEPRVIAWDARGRMSLQGLSWLVQQLVPSGLHCHLGQARAWSPHPPPVDSLCCAVMWRSWSRPRAHIRTFQIIKSHKLMIHSKHRLAVSVLYCKHSGNYVYRHV